MEEELEYWKKRCELAEEYIMEMPFNPFESESLIKAYNNWIKIINDRK